MKNIEIDFEVYKGLTALLVSEEETYNDVIRRMLELPPIQNKSVSEMKHVPEWISKGQGFPEGTQFRATYKGQSHLAEVKNGRLFFNGKKYKSFSGAAYAVTGKNWNGWNFWEQRRPGSSSWTRLY